MADIETLARRCYQAYVEKDRQMIEDLVAEDFSFTSPYDDHIDRASYFERCWPNAERVGDIRIRKVLTDGGEAIVLYEFQPRAGEAFHNSEYLRFKDGKLVAVEVFFGEINGVEQKAERPARSRS